MSAIDVSGIDETKPIAGRPTTKSVRDNFAAIKTQLSAIKTELEDLSGLVDLETARANLGLAIGADVQAYDDTLQSLSALGTAADKLPYTTDVDTWAETSLTSFARSLLDDADADEAMQTLNGVQVVSDAAKAATIAPTTTRKLSIRGADGGTFYGVTGAAAGTYVSNGDGYCGTVIAYGDGSAAWLREWDGGIAYINWFGATPGDTSAATGNVTAIEVAASWLGAGVLSAYPGRYYMASTAEIPVGVMIDGLRGLGPLNAAAPAADAFDDIVAFSPVTTGSYTENYLFFMNIARSAPTTWARSYPNIGSGGARRVAIYNDTANTINGFKFAGSYAFEEIYNYKVGTLIEKPNIYCDHVKIHRIHSAYRFNSTDYLIYLPGLGDSLDIRDISTGYTGNETGLCNGAYVNLVRGGEVFGLINGIHTFVNSACEVHGCHIEQGYLEVSDSELSIHDNQFFNEADNAGIPIQFQSVNDTYGNRYTCRVYDNTFVATDNARSGWVGRSDIQTNDAYTLILSNNRRKITKNGEVSKSQYAGIVIENGAGSKIDDYNNYSHILSSGTCVIANEDVLLTGATPALTVNFPGLHATNSTTDDFTVFDGASGTYYYQAQLLLDPVRLIGRNAINAEVALAITSGGNCPMLDIEFSTITYRSGYMLRVYRGMATGSYDQYVDIPLIATRRLYDQGVYLNNFPWIARTAGAVDALNNSAVTEGGVRLFDGSAVVQESSANAVPSAGAWKKGDRLMLLGFAVGAVGTDHWTETRRLTDGSAHVDGADWIKLAMVRA